MADLYPDGFRRWLATNLTGADELKGVRVAADAEGQPAVEDNLFPADGLGWTSWSGAEPVACFPTAGTNVCSRYVFDMSALTMTAEDYNEAPEHVAVLDPQVGWEQQKFLIAYTLLHLPANEKQQWLDMTRLWELGRDADPALDQRIELHEPNGRVWVARTFGTEVIFGATVQRGIGARILEYANALLAQAYETTGVDHDGDGTDDWFEVVRDEFGDPVVRFDPSMIEPVLPGETNHMTPGCSETEVWGCTCAANRACLRLQDYLSVPAYLRDGLSALGHVNTP